MQPVSSCFGIELQLSVPAPADHIFRMYFFANSQAEVDCGLVNPDFAAGSIFLAGEAQGHLGAPHAF